jgi:hypothetical protein
MALSKTVRAVPSQTQQSTCIVFARVRHVELPTAVSADATKTEPLYQPMSGPFLQVTGRLPQPALMHALVQDGPYRRAVSVPVVDW